MGQYHKPVSLTANEFIHPHQVGCGVKAWEIVANENTVCAALVGLISVNPGNGPADVSNNRMTGRWAGHRILCAGDYAEDGDAQNINNYSGPPLGELYSLCDGDNLLGDLGQPKDADTFYNISPSLLGLLEQACSVRFVNREGWYTYVKVKSMAIKAGDNRAHYELLAEDKETLDYYKRAIPNFNRSPWDRAPLDGSSHGVSDSEIGQGQTRVLANLDRREFIDPAFFGEVPTTAGIMRGDWGSAAAMTALLFEPDRRGGGDLYSGSPLIGTWRNGRLFASSQYDTPEFPTTDFIKTTWTNISSEALRMIATESKS